MPNISKETSTVFGIKHSELQIPINHIKEHLDTLSCFLTSAESLRALAYDGIAKNKINSMGQPTNDVWHQHLFTAFYLYRHAIELALKALCESLINNDVKDHDLEKIWNLYSNEDRITYTLKDQIIKAFEILKKFHVLNDEQLFRYHNKIKKKQIIDFEEMPNIEHKEMETLSYCAWGIRQAVLEAMHTNKGLV